MSCCVECGLTDGAMGRPNHDSMYTESLLRLLESNGPPSVPERLNLQLALHSVEGNINTLETQIQHLNNHVRWLRHTTAMLSKVADDHRAVLSPVRYLPPEILCDIFEIACESDTHLQHLPDDDAKLLAWTLGQVCQRWRAIVENQSSLWHIFSIITASSGSIQKNITEYRLQTQLKRAGQRPLEVYIKRTQVGNHHVQNNIFNIFLKSSPRWGYLQLLTPVKFLVDVDFKAIKANLPRLRSLRVYVMDSTRSTISHPVDLFSCAPQLDTVHFYNFLTVGPQLPYLPWSQITTYVGIEIHSSAQLEVLRDLPNLRKCVIKPTINVRDVPKAHPTSLIFLPHLEQLSVSTEEFLPSLVVPSLQSLSIKSALYSDPFRTVLDLLHRSDLPPIQHITIPSKQLLTKIDMIHELVRVVPNLNSFDTALSSSDAMQFMASLTSETRLLPLLQSLQIRMHDHACSPEQWRKGLSDLLDVRWSFAGNVTRLKFLRLKLVKSEERDVVTPDVRDRVQQLKKEGLDISILVDSYY